MRAPNTIHMIGHSAKVTPLAVEERAMLTGVCQTKMATIRALIRPASEDCQAGRCSTPSITSTTMIGMDATRKDSQRLSPTGVSN